MSKLIDETGNRYHSLTVIKVVGIKRYPSCTKRLWECRCDCGNTIITPMGPLKNGRTKSCGCLMKRNRYIVGRKHGMSDSRLFRIWANMLSRCTNPNTSYYKRYGGRGIKVCDEWNGEDGSTNFINWALKNGYEHRLTLDRINNNGNYEPSNCRWITNKAQQRNKSTNKLLTLNGETHCVCEWSEKIGISTNTLNQRLNRGWSVEKTLTTPIKKVEKEK